MFKTRQQPREEWDTVKTRLRNLARAQFQGKRNELCPVTDEIMFKKEQTGLVSKASLVPQ